MYTSLRLVVDPDDDVLAYDAENDAIVVRAGALDERRLQTSYGFVPPAAANSDAAAAAAAVPWNQHWGVGSKRASAARRQYAAADDDTAESAPPCAASSADAQPNGARASLERGGGGAKSSARRGGARRRRQCAPRRVRVVAGDAQLNAYLAVGALVVLGVMAIILASTGRVSQRQARLREADDDDGGGGGAPRPTTHLGLPIVEVPAVCAAAANVTDIEWFNAEVRPSLMPSLAAFACNTSRAASAVMCDADARIVEIVTRDASIADYPLATFCLARLAAFSSIVPPPPPAAAAAPELPLHAEWVTLPRLATLVLRDRRIGGTIPREFGQFALHATAAPDTAPLRTLDIGGTRLAGTIPSQLGAVESLAHLYITRTRRVAAAAVGNAVALVGVSGTIPRQVANLRHLRTLRLEQNVLSGSVPARLVHLTRLDTLHMYANALRGSVYALDALQVSQSCLLRASGATSASGNCFECPLPPDLRRKCSMSAAFNASLNCEPAACAQ